MIKVAVCGLGYWGPNILRNLSRNRNFQVVALADRSPERREAIGPHAPGAALFAEAIEAIECPDVEAVTISTPVASHFALARRALELGKPVLVEKPLCSNVDEASELVELSERTGTPLMVNHTFLFHPAVQKLGELTHSGALGSISYYDCLRVNLGLFQPDVNVLWDLAPHDISIIDYLFGEEPIHVQVNGYCHLNPKLPDIVYMTLHFPSRMVAHLNLSWMSPVKVRRTAVGGTDKMAVWDDLDRDQPIKIYDSGISVLPQEARSVIVPSYRIGDIHSPRLPNTEPLAAIVEHFARVIRGEEASRMDGRKGLKVVRILDWAQRALDATLADVDIHYNTRTPRVRTTPLDLQKRIAGAF